MTMTEFEKIRLKKIWKKILLFIAAVMFFLFTLELSLMIMKGVETIRYGNCLKVNEHEEFYESDERLDYVLKPNLEVCKYDKSGNKIYFYTNNIRARNKEQFNENKSDKKRVIMIGDSMLVGFYTNHNESYAERLKYYLGENYEVMTVGGSGYEIDRETILLRDKISLNSSPDIVIVNIYSNDYMYNANLNYFAGWRDRFLLGAIDPHDKIWPILVGNSSSYTANDGSQIPTFYSLNLFKNNTLEINSHQVKNKILLRYKLEDDAAKVYDAKNKESLFKKSNSYVFIKQKIEDFNNNILKKISVSAAKTPYFDLPYLALMSDEYSIELNSSILINFKLFESIYELGKDYNFTTVFVYLPDRFQLDEDYFQRMSMNVLFLDNKSLDKEKFNKFQSKFMYDMDYYYLDLLPHFNNISENIYVSKEELHWNSKGNDLAAKKVAEYLKEQGLV